MATKETLRIYLDRLEDAARLAGDRPADFHNPDLSLYHDALTQRFETAISQIYDLLAQALGDGGKYVRVGSTFTWVMRQSAAAGLISPDDCDSLCNWVIDRHATSHRYDDEAINAIVPIVPDLVACGHRVLDVLPG